MEYPCIDFTIKCPKVTPRVIVSYIESVHPEYLHIAPTSSREISCIADSTRLSRFCILIDDMAKKYASFFSWIDEIEFGRRCIDHYRAVAEVSIVLIIYDAAVSILISTICIDVMIVIDKLERILSKSLIPS